MNLVSNYMNKLEKENKELKKEIEIMKTYLEIIRGLGFDYDGCNTVEGLKELVDDLTAYAAFGIECNKNKAIYVNGNEKYNILHERIN